MKAVACSSRTSAAALGQRLSDRTSLCVSRSALDPSSQPEPAASRTSGRNGVTRLRSTDHHRVSAGWLAQRVSDRDVCAETLFTGVLFDCVCVSVSVRLCSNIVIFTGVLHLLV